jgi:hypothetical protein
LIDLGAAIGLMVVFRKSKQLALFFVAVLVVYPLIYYASQVVSRYRHPVDPVLYALGGIAALRILKLGRKGRPHPVPSGQRN